MMQLYYLDRASKIVRLLSQIIALLRNC